jgi:hypothetical protein
MDSCDMNLLLSKQGLRFSFIKQLFNLLLLQALLIKNQKSFDGHSTSFSQLAFECTASNNQFCTTGATF